FVSKIDPHGAKLVYSTLIGGAGLTDTPSSIAVDSNGNAYITGLSQSKVYPTTPGAFQTKGGGVFVTKFNPAGTALVYSTFLNPNGSPSGFLPAITVDGAGNAYVTGLMGGGLPTTSGAFKSTGSGGFLTVLDAAADTAVYSSYIGGDEGTAIALDSSGNVYVAGAASSANVPATTGAFKSAPIAGGANAFVVKFSFPATTQPAISGVVNGASSVAGVVAGSFASIYGSNLSPATDVWDKSIVNGALPIALDGVSVMVGGKPAYLSYISPGQINFLAPDIAAGPVSVTVNNGSAISAPSRWLPSNKGMAACVKPAWSRANTTSPIASASATAVQGEFGTRQNGHA
ncbi:MAG: SBBP repeat-containing protein, partial [Verrucomicrobiota bacterium]